MVYVDITCANGRPIQELTKLIEQRSKWLNETAEESCAACMIDVLVSLRALTTVAKPKRTEIKISATTLTCSFTTHGKKKIPRLRLGKAQYALEKNQRVGYATQDFKNCQVWKWVDVPRKRIWLIVAHSEKEAQNWAYEKVKKRAKHFKGLARLAFSKLMMLTGSKTAQKMDNPEAASKLPKYTRVLKYKNGGTYTLNASDMLQYAKLALKGGDAAINQAIMKASNKITSVINTKCKNILSFEKLKTPFPEVSSRK